VKAFMTFGLAISIAMGGLGFEVYFADPGGEPISLIWEGNRFTLVVTDPDKGACGLDSFQADLVIFDFKTGAYIEAADQEFREFEAGSGLYFWVDGAGNKRAVRLGGRKSFSDLEEMEHNLGDPLWQDGNWTYVDEDVEATLATGSPDSTAMGDQDGVPTHEQAARFQFTGYDADLDGTVEEEECGVIEGRFENMDTVIAIVADQTDRRNVAGDQLKVIDTESALEVSPEQLSYGCGAGCSDIVVTIQDPDENLDCNQVEYVPFFVIVNPGGFTPDDGNVALGGEPGNDHVAHFCGLRMYGGVLGPGQSRFAGAYVAGDPIRQPIRWYNIYDAPVSYQLKDPATGALSPVAARFIDYPNQWLDPEVVAANGNVGLGRALFYATETSVDSGVFTYNFGNLEQLQLALGFREFPPGTTIAFYYLDPNDFDDLAVAWVEVGDRPHSKVYITDPNRLPVLTIRIGDGIYILVLDADANIEACCQDSVAVQLCDPHGEDDCEWWELDEVSNDSGVFFSQAGMPLLPVWDAVGGYQLVWYSDTFEAFNEDTILVRYTSVKVELR